MDHSQLLVYSTQYFQCTCKYQRKKQLDHRLQDVVSFEDKIIIHYLSQHPNIIHEWKGDFNLRDDDLR